VSLWESEPVVYRAPEIVIVRQVEAREIPDLPKYDIIESIPPQSFTEEPVCTGSFCSCIIYLQLKGHGVSGDAKDLQPNYFGVPHKGDLALFKYSNGVYHAAYVEAVFPSGAFYISEANYRAGKYTERTIFPDDSFLRGFIHHLK